MPASSSGEAYDRMSDEERRSLGERCCPHDEAFNGGHTRLSARRYDD